MEVDQKMHVTGVYRVIVMTAERVVTITAVAQNREQKRLARETLVHTQRTGALNPIPNNRNDG